MNQSKVDVSTRRGLLGIAGAAGGAVLFLGTPAAAWQAKKKEEGEEEVSTNEDLMREHGILKRVLLVTKNSKRTTSIRGFAKRASWWIS